MPLMVDMKYHISFAVCEFYGICQEVGHHFRKLVRIIVHLQFGYF